MRHESHGKTVVQFLITPMLLVLLANVAVAQEGTKEVAKKATGDSVSEQDAKTSGGTTAEKTEAGKKPRKKPRGRLPTYFSRVVTEKQRSEIYDIQAKYADQIAALKKQLDELAETRDTEVDKVLSDEQRAEVTKLRNARAGKKSKTSAESTSTDS